MVAHLNSTVIIGAPLEAPTEGESTQCDQALIKEMEERLHVLKLASCEFRAEMTEKAARSRDRIFPEPGPTAPPGNRAS